MNTFFILNFAVDMCFSRANMQTITLVTKFVGRTHGQNAQFPIELRPRKRIHELNTTHWSMRLVRRLQHTSCRGCRRPDREYGGVCAFLFIYNKVSTDFANWMKTITNIIILTLKT